jgi:hypothetical protein
MRRKLAKDRRGTRSKAQGSKGDKGGREDEERKKRETETRRERERGRLVSRLLKKKKKSQDQV